MGANCQVNLWDDPLKIYNYNAKWPHLTFIKGGLFITLRSRYLGLIAINSANKSPKKMCACAKEWLHDPDWKFVVQ